MRLIQFDMIDATFSPKRTDDLTRGAKAWIGKRAEWEVLWEIDEGPYAGQMAVGLSRPSRDEAPPFSWAPSCDFLIHKKL